MKRGTKSNTQTGDVNPPSSGGGSVAGTSTTTTTTTTIRKPRIRHKKKSQRSAGAGLSMFVTVMGMSLWSFGICYFGVVVYFLYRLQGVEQALKRQQPLKREDSVISPRLERYQQQLRQRRNQQSLFKRLVSLVRNIEEEEEREEFYTVRERGTRVVFVGNNQSDAPHTSTEVVDMRDLSATLAFDNPDGGAWKQGWNVPPREIGINNSTTALLHVFVIPHSHCDPGWLKTFDEYFQQQTKNIISSVISALEEDPRRTFIWAEISYFAWWWDDQTPNKRESVRNLLRRKQLEFVTGGWVQPDEANSNMDALEIQMQEGHDWIAKNVGPEFIPRYGWSIDPFGYSPSLPYLLKTQFQFKAILIQRVHYAVKKELAKRKHLEFYWRQTWDTNGEYDMFTHLMPFYSYDVPHTCGPDPAVCCQFDFGRLPIGKNGNCPWGRPPLPIDSTNVKERALLLLDQYLKKANLYRGNAVLIPLGDDFRYQTPKEATDQYTNYQRMFDYINQNVDGVQIQFGTLSQYFETIHETFDPPILKGSFFTYSDVNQDYWSGYFTSRVFDKALDRQLERVLYAAESLGATRLDLQFPRRQLSLFQHHDGVTGTAKTPVVKDYAKRMYTAIQNTYDWILDHLGERNPELAFLLSAKPIFPNNNNNNVTNNDNTTSGSTANVTSDHEDEIDYDPSSIQPCYKANDPRGLSENMCQDGERVFAFNPLLDTSQHCGSVEIQGGQVVPVTLPCETPGPAIHDDASTSLPHQEDGGEKMAARFDPVTGRMIWPIKEEWNVWVVNKGGAYLFFPDRMIPYQAENVSIEHGGYVVQTKFWRRTVVERRPMVDIQDSNIHVSAFDFIYEINLQEDNREWFVRFTAAEHIANNKTFHTDLNGFNFDTHHHRDDLPIQSQVFPMPAHAAIQDNATRLTVLSEHAQGTASLVDGAIDVFLDRRLKQDDQRGLGQGVLDNVATRTRFRIVLERQRSFSQSAFDPTAEFQITRACRQEWNQLNHPLEFFGLRTKHSLEHAISMETAPPVYSRPARANGAAAAAARRRGPLVSQEEQNKYVPPGYAAAYPHLVQQQQQVKNTSTVLAGAINPATIQDADYLKNMHAAGEGGGDTVKNYLDHLKESQQGREKLRQQLKHNGQAPNN